jgi:glc operon protein GlcG
MTSSPHVAALIQEGKIIGAIGCSGGTGSQDEVVCSAAAALVK